MWWEFPPKSIQMLERFSCLVPASTTCRAVAVAKADQLSSDGQRRDTQIQNSPVCIRVIHGKVFCHAYESESYRRY